MVDATLGLAGHSIAFLERYPELSLMGVDADSEVQKTAEEKLGPYQGRVSLWHGYFDEFFNGWKKEGKKAGIILFDFGLSMYHFRESKRGFSMHDEEDLDMRLNQRTGRTASAMIAEMDARQLAGIIRDYGEEPFAWKIAQAIVRERGRIQSSRELAELIKETVPGKYRHGRIHPATRTFQALRILVNDELGRIERALDDAIACLEEGGVIGAISFHSLEDRIVKHKFRQYELKNEKAGYSRQQEEPIPRIEGGACLKLITKKPLLPGDDEVRINPASRSAKFRAARRILQ